MIQIRQFTGLSPIVEKPGELLFAQNVRVKHGKLFTVPDSLPIYSNIAAEKGLYVWGHRQSSVIVAIGQNSRDWQGSVFPKTDSLVLSILDYRSEKVYQVILSDYGVPHSSHVPAVVLGQTMWLNAGGVLWELTPGAPFDISKQAMTVGYEAGTASYLTTPPDAEIMTVHNGRVFYAGLSNKLHALTEAVDPEDVPVLAALAEGKGKYGYAPNQIVFSEAYQPNAIKAWSFIAVDEYQARITGLVSYNHSLYIFTETGVWQYSGDDPLTATLEKIPNVEGCIAHRTIQVVNDTLFWVGPTGINYLGPKGYGKVPGLDVFFNLDSTDTQLRQERINIFLDKEGLTAAAARIYGYYVLRINANLLALVDVETKGATLWTESGLEVSSIVGIGNAQIGGSYCDILFGNFPYNDWNIGKTIDAFLWDGNSCSSSIKITVPDVIERIPWRSVSVLSPHVGRMNDLHVSIQDYAEAKEVYNAHILPAGFESMQTIGKDWQIGTSPLYDSREREWTARFSVRTSIPLIGIELETNRALPITGLVLDGGPGPVKVQNA